MFKTRPNSPRHVLTVALSLLVSGAANAQNAPSPLPAFPGGFAPIVAPKTGSIVAGAPQVSEWTRTANPGDSIILSGERFSSFSDARIGSDTRFWAWTPNGARVPVDILRLSGENVALSLPKTLSASGPIWIWPQNAAGIGRAAILNSPEAWWVGPDKVRDGKFSLYGRNLPATTRLFLQGESGRGRWISSLSANSFKADFVIPASFPVGTYRAWMFGTSWVRPLSLEVGAPLVWTGKELNVRDFGAKGDGEMDDAPAVQAAFEAARHAPFSTVVFPAGTFALGTTISNWPWQTRVRGAGKDLTKIVARHDFTGGEGLFTGSLREGEVRDIGFDTLGHVPLKTSVRNSLFHARGSADVRFIGCRFSQADDLEGADAAPLDLHLCERIGFENCDFICSGGLFLGTSRQIFFEGSRFYGTNDCNALIYTWGGREVAVTNCFAGDLDSSGGTRGGGYGWGQGRWFTGNGVWGAISHIYFAGNTSKDLTVRPEFGNQNTGEQFMMEGLGVRVRSHVLSATKSSVNFPGAEKLDGQIVVIVAGMGVGQARQIVGSAPDGMSVDEPWNVVPDSSSIVSGGAFMYQMAVVDNTFDGKTRGVTNPDHIASAGVEPFGGAAELVVRGNTFHEIRYGISNWSMSDQVGGAGDSLTQPNVWNEFSGNKFVDCRDGVGNQSESWGHPPAIGDIAFLGNIFRGNTFSGLSGGAFSTTAHASTAAVGMTVYDHNSGSNIERGAHDDGAYDDQIWTRNSLRTRAETLSLEPKASPVLSSNAWHGHPTLKGAALAGTLEIPLRVCDVSVNREGQSSGVFAVVNAGAEALNWRANASQGWLRVVLPKGRLTSQERGAVFFVADARGLRVGQHLGYLSVSANGKSQQVSVHLSVTGRGKSSN